MTLLFLKWVRSISVEISARYFPDVRSRTCCYRVATIRLSSDSNTRSLPGKRFPITRFFSPLASHRIDLKTRKISFRAARFSVLHTYRLSRFASFPTRVGYLSVCVSCSIARFSAFTAFHFSSSINVLKSRGKHLFSRNRCNPLGNSVTQLFRNTISYRANEALTFAALTPRFCIVSSTQLIELKSFISPTTAVCLRITR